MDNMHVHYLSIIIIHTLQIGRINAPGGCGRKVFILGPLRLRLVASWDSEGLQL